MEVFPPLALMRWSREGERIETAGFNVRQAVKIPAYKEPSFACGSKQGEGLGRQMGSAAPILIFRDSR